MTATIIISQKSISNINTGETWYNQELSYPLRSESILLKQKEKVCPCCGAVIARQSDKCANCASKEHRVVKNRPNREELKKLIRTKSFCQIGAEYKVTDNAIRKWCDAENLPRTKKEIKSYSDKKKKKI